MAQLCVGCIKMLRMRHRRETWGLKQQKPARRAVKIGHLHLSAAVAVATCEMMKLDLAHCKRTGYMCADSGTPRLWHQPGVGRCQRVHGQGGHDAERAMHPRAPRSLCSHDEV